MADQHMITDQFISEFFSQKRIKDVFEHHPIKSVIALKNGSSTDKLYKIDLVNNACYVLKMSNDRSHLNSSPPALCRATDLAQSFLDKNYAQSVLLQELLAEKNLTAKILYKDIEEKIIIMEYIEYEKFPTGLERVTLFSNFLKKLHSIDQKTLDGIDLNINYFDFYQVLSDRVAFLKDSAVISTDHLKKFSTVLSNKSYSGQMCLCHNDLHSQNAFFSFGQIKAIDWMMAGFSDPFFDLAMTASWCFMWTNERNKLLENYLNRSPNQDEMLHFKAMQNLSLAIPASFMLLKLSKFTHRNYSESPLSLPEFLCDILLGKVSLNEPNAIYNFSKKVIDSINI